SSLSSLSLHDALPILSHVGFGFFLVVALNGLRHVLRTIAMRLSVTPEHRRFTFLQAFAARLGGESMSFLTFAGPLLGEATKVALDRKSIRLNSSHQII